MKTKKVDFTLVVIIGLLALSLCFSTAAPSYSYASPVLSWSTNPSITENESIDVAHTDCIAEGSYLTITVTNAYPGYESNIVGEVVNTVGFPINLSDLTLTNNHPDFINVTAARSGGSSLDPGESFTVDVNLKVTDQAEQNRTGENAYTFQIVLTAQQQSGGDNDNGGDNGGGDNGGGDNGGGNNGGGDNGGGDSNGNDNSEQVDQETLPEPPAMVPEIPQGTISVPVEELPQGELPRTGSSSVLWFASALSLITAGLMTRFKYFD
jgi:uncharacterized membrane protein YgcG